MCIIHPIFSQFVSSLVHSWASNLLRLLRFFSFFIDVNCPLIMIVDFDKESICQITWLVQTDPISCRHGTTDKSLESQTRKTWSRRAIYRKLAPRADGRLFSPSFAWNEGDASPSRSAIWIACETRPDDEPIRHRMASGVSGVGQI